MIVVDKTVEKIEPVVGMESCVWVSGTPPHHWGNYFSFASGERCVNMWSENLRAITEKLALREVECTVFSYQIDDMDGMDGMDHPNLAVSADIQVRLAFVTDPRIPKDWLYDGICITGFGGAPTAVLQAMYEFAGLSTEENICGCEKPVDIPRITKMTQGHRVTYQCTLCNRIWTKN